VSRTAVPPLTHSAVLAWVEAHDEAWRSNDPARIGELFSEDGIYHLGPFEGPWRGYRGPIVGRRAIADAWAAAFDPGERFEATSDVVAIDGRRAVVRRVITYEGAGREPAARFGCVWVLDFDPDGRCREYQEWFVEEAREAPGRG
jgi:nuclear transport factor 2 (NTF2) superfamily protein